MKMFRDKKKCCCGALFVLGGVSCVLALLGGTGNIFLHPRLQNTNAASAVLNSHKYSGLVSRSEHQTKGRSETLRNQTSKLEPSDLRLNRLLKGQGASGPRQQRRKERALRFRKGTKSTTPKSKDNYGSNSGVVHLKRAKNTNTPRLLCWIIADPHLLNTKVVHQKNTWARKCHKLLVMSSKQNDSFPAIGLNVSSGRSHLEEKVKAAWIYIYQHHIEDYDFFIRCDTDTYVVVDNLLDYLRDKDPEAPHYYGHKYRPPSFWFSYMAGGPGIVLTRAAVKRLILRAFVEYPNCMFYPNVTAIDDLTLCKCLALVGCEAQDTRDAEGKERFIVFDIEQMIHGYYAKWYRNYVSDPRQGSKCCSDYPVSFHYIKPTAMYALEYWLYHAKVKGRETEKVPWPKITAIAFGG